METSGIAARQVSVTTDVGSLTGFVVGPRPDVPTTGPVVVWPSLFSTHAVQAALVDRLAQHAPVLALDPPGHGASRLGGTAALDLRACLRATLELLDEAGPPFADEPLRWVGTSWGGLVGVLAAVHAPHRLDHLACLNTPFAFTPRRDATSALPLLARSLGSTALFARMTARSFFLPGTRAARTGPRATALAAHRATFTEGDRRGLSAAARLLFRDRDDLRPLLPEVGVRTLVVAGRHDAMYAALAQQEAAALVPDSRCVLVDSAHISVVDALEEVLVALREDWAREPGGPEG